MAGENAEVRIIADLQRYVDEVKKLGPVTDQEAIKAAFALESRVTKASEKAAKAAETAAKQAAEASTRAAKKTGDAFDAAGDKGEKSFQKAAKAAALTGDALGGFAGPIGDIGDAFELMDTKTALVTVSVAALVGAFGGVLAASLDVIRNADDYAVAMGGNEEAVRKAETALGDLDEAFARQKVAMAETMAPAISKLSYAYIGITDNIARAVDYLANTSFVSWITEASGILSWLDGQAERGRKIAEREQAKADAAEAEMMVFQKSFEEFEREQDEADKRREQRRKAAQAAAKKAAEQEAKEFQAFITGIGADVAAALQAMEAEQKRIDDEAFTKFVEAYDKRQAYLNKIAPELQDLAAELLDIPDVEFRISSKFDTDLANAQMQEAISLTEARLAEIARLEDEAAHEAFVKREEERKAYEKSQVDGVASISGYVGQTLDTISGMFDENTKEGRKAIRELAVAQKAAAIFDVAIKGVQAVMAALTVPPPAGTALAVVAGAAAVASAAAVAAQPLPSFHTGRFAGAIQPVQPDEGPALLRRGEVVVPATTVAANGGVDQVRRRLGESSEGGGRVNVFLDLTDRTVRVPLARDIARSMNRTAYLGWAT
jgi:hypothetical protein